MSNREEALIPKLGVITDVRIDTPDIKTFRVVTPDGKKVFEHRPGQCAMLSIPGVGEAMFSITSSPTNTEYMEFSIKKCGCLTDWLHLMDVGQQITMEQCLYGILVYSANEVTNAVAEHVAGDIDAGYLMAVFAGELDDILLRLVFEHRQSGVDVNFGGSGDLIQHDLELFDIGKRFAAGKHKVAVGSDGVHAADALADLLHGETGHVGILFLVDAEGAVVLAIIRDENGYGCAAFPSFVGIFHDIDRPFVIDCSNSNSTRLAEYMTQLF